MLELIVDQAGKVRSAVAVGAGKSIDAELINAALSWKFIPAQKGDRPVASRFRMVVSGKQ
jgi:hypothetical protein